MSQALPPEINAKILQLLDGIQRQLNEVKALMSQHAQIIPDVKQAITPPQLENTTCAS